MIIHIPPFMVQQKFFADGMFIYMCAFHHKTLLLLLGVSVVHFLTYKMEQQNKQRKHFHPIIKYCLFISLLISSVNAGSFEGKRFSEVLQKFAERTLGIDKMQRYLDYNVNYEAPIHPDGQQLLNEIVDQEISPMLRNLIGAVTNLRDSVEDTLNDEAGTYTKGTVGPTFLYGVPKAIFYFENLYYHYMVALVYNSTHK